MELLKHQKKSFFDEKLNENEKMDREDLFVMDFAPKWFTFVGWLLIVGVLEYLRIETNSHFVIVILWAISYGILLWYINAILFNTHFYRLIPSKYLKNGRAVRIANVTIAIIPFALVIHYLSEIVTLLSKAP
jgi:hypothetical protein